MPPGVKNKNPKFVRSKNPGLVESWASAGWWDALLWTGLQGLSTIGIFLSSTQSFEIHVLILDIYEERIKLSQGERKI